MAKVALGDAFAAALSRMARQVQKVGGGAIPVEMTFLQWLYGLQDRGLKIDGKPFRLDDRKALLPIYEAIPSTREEARGRIVVVQKATQLGLTVWEVLAHVYMALKFGPVNIGMFMPDQSTASFKSEHRFMRIMRSSGELLRLMTHREDEGKDRKVGEGNILTRVLGESILMFLWTSGRVTTESRPMDIVGLDEAQEMTLDQIDKVMARMGDSEIGMALMLSTANMPGADINYWYMLGDQRVWHTQCPSCGALSDLSDPAGIFPDRSIKYERGEYYWACPSCGGTILDPQDGRYIPAVKREEDGQRLRRLRAEAEGEDSEVRDEDDAPNKGHGDPDIISFLIPRTISPKITPRKMISAWNRTQTGHQKKSFYNRTLARPYIDAEQLPVTMAHCLAAVEAGRKAGVTWKRFGREALMGIDQMGSFNAVIIKERLRDGRQAVIHVEAVFGESPFDRCTELMEQYRVSVCVVEQLPNVNDARRFANLDAHRGRVFLAGYADLKDDAMIWGDDLSKSDRRTSEEDRSRYSVTLNQYKCMQTALFRVRDGFCLFPDPNELIQEVLVGGRKERMPILNDWVFLHLTKVALVVEQEGEATTATRKRHGMQEARKSRAKVMKVGIDPHYAYANMLCDVAWARNHGTGMVWFPDRPREDKKHEDVQQAWPGLPHGVASHMVEPPKGEVCGRCTSYDRERGNWCAERDFSVRANDPGCSVFVPG